MDTVTPEMPSLLSTVLSSGWIVLSVLGILIFLSVWSWAITIAKFLQFRRARSKSAEFSDLFWESRNFARIDDSSRRLQASPLARVFSSGYRELSHILQEMSGGGGSSDLETNLGAIERAMKRSELSESHRLEKGLTFLATTASAAPFVGLFGTVWGIMNAFHGLSQVKGTTLQAVAPGISEALVATAVGLAAAIPAAAAYNYFAVGVRQFRQSMNSFCDEFLNIARRHFVK